MREKTYSKNPEVVSRNIADEVILVPIKSKLADVNAIYLLKDDVSRRIWELVDGKRNIKDIKEIICDEFAVKSEVAEKDIAEFIRQLRDSGCVTEIKS